MTISSIHLVAQEDSGVQQTMLTLFKLVLEGEEEMVGVEAEGVVAGEAEKIKEEMDQQQHTISLTLTIHQIRQMMN